MTMQTEIKVRKVFNKVKNTFTALVVLAIIGSMAACNTTTEKQYTRYCVAVTVDKLQTNDGNIYVGDYELFVGCVYEVVFSDEGTPDDVTDDLIVSQKSVTEKRAALPPHQSFVT